MSPTMSWNSFQADAASQRIAAHVDASSSRNGAWAHSGVSALQVGVGNIGNGVMAALGSSPDIPPL
jgi:acyl-CoA hydrolase